jgi:hypothetical protein
MQSVVPALNKIILCMQVRLFTCTFQYVVSNQNAAGIINVIAFVIVNTYLEKTGEVQLQLIMYF